MQTSFQVSSKVDSRTIIDQMGAEKLLGKGDLLFLEPGSASPIRLHNAFITLEEIENVLSHINSQPMPEEIKLPEATINSDTGQGAIVKVVLKFVPLTGVTEVPLDDASDQIIFVVNCVGKPLTRTRIGS